MADWLTYVSIENGATLNNTGTITDLINAADYYTSTETIKYTYNDKVGTLGENARVEKVAAVFDRSQLQAVWNDGSYVNVIVSGPNAASDNIVELGGVIVPRGQRLVLKSSVFDGTNTYRNSYTVSSGTLTVTGEDENQNDGRKGELVTVGAPEVTVARGGKILTYGFAAFDRLTVNGHVDCEADMMIVAQSLTIGEAGKLEIGGEGHFQYKGEAENYQNNGTLLATKRYMDGLDEENIFTQSKISGVTATGTFVSLVITDNVILTGNHTVDMIVPYEGTLRVAPGGSLRYKEVHEEVGFTGQLLGNIATDEDGYRVLTANATGVSTYADLVAALKDKSVTHITVNDNITIRSEDHWTQLDITKPVVIAAGKKLTVAHYDGNAPKSQLIMNEIVIKDGGSLTLGEGATLTATEERNTDGMFYRYFGRVYVDYGGKLDVSHGVVTSGSAIYYPYGEENSKRIIVGENIPDNITFAVYTEDQLRGAMADPKCTGGIEADMDITLTDNPTDNLTVNKYLLINDYQKLIVPENVTLTVPAGQTLQVSGQLYVYGKVVNHGFLYGFDIIDVYGGTLENAGVTVGDGNWPGENDILDRGTTEELLEKFAAVLPQKENDLTGNISVQPFGEQTFSRQIFKNPITITCGTSQVNEDGFGGDIRFRNCTFENGVTVQLAAGIGYNIRLENCTGSFTATATDAEKRANNTGVNFFGDLGGVTVNGLTISGTAGWQDEEYNINARYDECGDEGNTSYISTVEVTNRRNDKTVSISTGNGTYSGKLRIGGNVAVTDVTGDMIERVNHEEEPGGNTPDSTPVREDQNGESNDEPET